MIVVEGTIRVPDLGAALPSMIVMLTASRAEPGCISYSYAIDILDPTLVHVVERWESREALKAHLTSEHIRDWRAGWLKLRIGERDLRMYEAEAEPF
jgi:quinol monooxygenase YgiN